MLRRTRVTEGVRRAELTEVTEGHFKQPCAAVNALSNFSL